MLLLTIYLAAFVLGGILLAASLFLGHGDSDGDIHVDADGELDAGGDLEGAGDSDLDGGGDHDAGLSDFWLPFLSVRFWVYFLCFFGLTGTALTLLALAGKWITLLAALLMGVATGFAAAYIIQRLKHSEVGSVATEEDFEGLEATVRLPISPEDRGKVRVIIRDQSVDLIARSEDSETLEVGQKVLIIGFNGSEAVVSRIAELETIQEGE